MAGKIIADQIEHSTAGSLDTSYVVQGSAKAWADYSGSGTSYTASFNFSSATDNGTGDYTVTFTSAMGSGNFSINGIASAAQIGDEYTVSFSASDTSSSSRRIFSSTNYQPGQSNGIARDNIMNVSVFGDLA